MFCPTCGLTEDRQVQYCRSCGTDLRAIRTSLTAPDPNSAAGAREGIGRALAELIREVDDVSDLEDALPAIEKFLETPAQKRLRRMRAGTITAAVGAGATIFFFLFAMMQSDLLFTVGIGFVCFLIGIGMILNGVFLTLPDKADGERLPAQLNDSIRQYLPQAGAPNVLATGETRSRPDSVTENTTRHLGGSSIETPDPTPGN